MRFWNAIIDTTGKIRAFEAHDSHELSPAEVDRLKPVISELLGKSLLEKELPYTLGITEGVDAVMQYGHPSATIITLHKGGPALLINYLLSGRNKEADGRVMREAVQFPFAVFEEMRYEPRAEVFDVKERPLMIGLPGELADPNCELIRELRAFSLNIAAAFFEGVVTRFDKAGVVPPQ